MKILHCADVHLGSKMESRFPKEKADERRMELRAALNRLVSYANENGVGVIILAGDIFDSDRPLKKDKEFFYSVVKNNPQIDFLYLRGNHDVMESYTEYGFENLKTFSDEWTSYEYGGIVITGIESGDKNSSSMYSTLQLDKSKINVVVLHGQIAESDGVYKIHLSRLRNKNIDYLALGHIHAFSDGKIDERGRYVYPGCLEGRGFDEPGRKGFVEIEINDGVRYKFIPDSYRNIDEVTVDISDAEDTYSACRKIRSFIKSAPRDMVRINIAGEVGFDAEGLEKEVEKQLAREYYLVSVKNKTVRQFDIDKLSGDLSLKGEFIRTVLKSTEYTDEEKSAVISCGLRALSGREID